MRTIYTSTAFVIYRLLSISAAILTSLIAVIGVTALLYTHSTAAQAKGFHNGDISWNKPSLSPYHWNFRSNDLPLINLPDLVARIARPETLKNMPRNALKPAYTAEMAQSDRMLARIFGGDGAVAAGNSFEPVGLAKRYPLYRGDLIADDGRMLRGHLSFAMHLYGSTDGTVDTALYVPAGFTSHSDQPTPTDAAVTFYYPRLGNLTHVTLAVFHVSNFQLSYQGSRVRIGTIGGRGGSIASYRHSHLEFYHGDTGLPTAASRVRLRIDPVAVFEYLP